MRVGERIRFALHLCEELGSINSRDLLQAWGDQTQTNCCKYLKRAVAMGLMEQQKDDFIHTFTLVEGWKERIYGEKPRQYIKRIKPVNTVRMGANSVFNLAA